MLKAEVVKQKPQHRESTGEDIYPVLKPIHLPDGAEYQYGVWFVLSDITGSDSDSDLKNGPAPEIKKDSKSSKFKSWLKGNIPRAGTGSHGDLDVVPIKMTTSEFESHFKTDYKSGDYAAGDYTGDVTEPKGGRLNWVRQRYEEQQPKSRKIREVSGYAVKANAAGDPAGGLVGPFPLPGGGGV